MTRLQVDLLDPVSGDPVAGTIGPLRSVSRWRWTSRMNSAGEVSADFLASDAGAPYVTSQRILSARAYLDDSWVEVGSGRIDGIGTAIRGGDDVGLAAVGLDLIGELRKRTVGDLAIAASNSSVDFDTALSMLQAFAPAGWTFESDPDDTDMSAEVQVYARFAGESVLGALVMLAERTRTYFYRPEGRTLQFRRTWRDSGIRAVLPGQEIGPDQCAIVHMTRQVETHELQTRIYTSGHGEGDTKLTLAACTLEESDFPPGYTINKEESYIESNNASAAYGLMDFPRWEYKDIGAIVNTDSDLEAAANMLARATFYDLLRVSTLAQQEQFTLTVEGCRERLEPLQTIWVTARDDAQGIDIDREMFILEATSVWEAETGDLYTAELVVSTHDRWITTDESAGAERAAQGQVFRAHPQVGPNSYWENTTLIVGSDQEDHLAKFPVFFLDEVFQIQRVLLVMKPEPVVNFVSVVAGKAEFEVDVEIDNSTIGIEIDNSTINIGITGDVTLDPHDHDVPNHQHPITVAGGSGGSANLILDTPGGGLGFLQKASAGDVIINTDVDGGATTSEESGGGTVDLNATATGTGTGTGVGTGTGEGSGTIDLSDAITVGHGVFKAADNKTFGADDLEFRVNGKGLNEDGEWDTVDDTEFFWVSLDAGTAVGSDGYQRFDITGAVRNPVTRRPSQADGYNLIEVRCKDATSSIAIVNVSGTGTIAAVSTDDVFGGGGPHGLLPGDQVTITGNGTFDGTYVVIEVVDEVNFIINHTHVGIVGGGQIDVSKSAMVLAKLGVVNMIQAISYE